MSGPTPARGWSRIVAALVGAAVVTSGCGATTSNEPGADPADPMLLSLAVYGPAPVVTAYSTIAANYSITHPNVSVSIEPYADAAEALAGIATQRASGTAPDLFLAPVEAVAGLERDEAIRSVGDLLLDRDVDFGDGFQRYSLEAFSSENSLQCMPVDSSPMVVYYNTDLVDLSTLNTDLQPEVSQETGWSFEQFERAARAPQADGVRGVYLEPSVIQLAPFIFSGGGKLLDDLEEPTGLVLSDGSTKNALQEVLPLFRDPVVNFGQQELARVAPLKRFANGKLAMMLGYRSLTPQLRAVEGLNFDVMPVPKVGSQATIGETSGICLNGASNQLEEAADFLAYLVSDEATALLTATGYVVPSSNDIANSDVFLQSDLQPAHAEVFIDQVRSIRAMPSATAWPEVVRATIPMISELLYDPLIQSLEERLADIDEFSTSFFASEPAGTPTP